MVPMIGWLVSLRVPLVRALTPVWWWPALFWLAGAGAVWLVGEPAGGALFRQLALVRMLKGVVCPGPGGRLVRPLLFPPAYARLPLPFGEELLPLLQTFPARNSA